MGRNSQSPFTDSNDLKKWGWRSSTLGGAIYEDDLDSVFLELGTSLDDFKTVNIDHKEVVVDGLEYPENGGKAYLQLNTAAGVLVADKSDNAIVYNRRKPLIRYPPLVSWSDLTFLAYQQQAAVNGHDIRKLRYVVRAGIANDNTRAIMNWACGVKDDYPPWENRAVFGMDTEQGQALLGTPNGSGIAWLLINHKLQLGIKTVDKVSVFSVDNYPFLLFELKDV
ncbi:hypothetical protein PVAG01_01991 [Phlyctema vagabunda]|uniref:Uncharacterized protein n=1 Tax=Phlyctema vagabunda TaxID=108571 RepID=A0ABR4PZ73_9HELO